MQVSRSPTARWTSAAATAESTPPDSAQMTRPSDPVSAGVGVDPLADVGDGRLDEVAGGPGRRDPRDVDHEVAQDVLAARGVDDLRVELDAVQVARGVDQAGERRGVRLGRGVEPLGQARDRVAVAHPDRLLALDPGEQRLVRGGDADVGGSVLAVVERDDVATELVGHQLGAVADAEDGDAAGPDRRVGPGSARVVDRVRAAGQDDRPGAAPFQLGVRRVVGQQLRVDIELADAARDELGELAAEVEDDDGLAVVGVGRGGAIGGRAIRGGRLERGLEVGLDLGVVRGKDPVAGVRGLAVDGLAAPRRRGCVLLAQSTSSCDPAAPPGWRQCTGRRPARRLTRGCASPPRPS